MSPPPLPWPHVVAAKSVNGEETIYRYRKVVYLLLLVAILTIRKEAPFQAWGQNKLYCGLQMKRRVQFCSGVAYFLWFLNSPSTLFAGTCRRWVIQTPSWMWSHRGSEPCWVSLVMEPARLENGWAWSLRSTGRTQHQRGPESEYTPVILHLLRTCCEIR